MANLSFGGGALRRNFIFAVAMLALTIAVSVIAWSGSPFGTPITASAQASSTPVVTLTASRDSTSEQNRQPVTFTVNVAPPPDEDLSLSMNFAGTGLPNSGEL